MFNRPPSAQSYSRLLTLPLEIRTPILECVVAIDEPIPAVRDNIEPPKLRLDILRVCQQLYDESISLFRSFNTPRMSIHLDFSDPWVTDWHTGRSGVVQSISYNKFLSTSVPQFNTLHVVVSAHTLFNDQSRVSGRLSALRKAVSLLETLDMRDKTLSIKFDAGLEQTLDIGNADAEWIDIIAEIRCKKISVEDVENSSITRMIEVIEGRSHIPNVRLQCREVLDHFLACQLNIARSVQLYSSDKTLEKDLQNAARISRMVEYEEIRTKILIRCDELVEERRIKHEEFKAILAGTG